MKFRKKVQPLTHLTVSAPYDSYERSALHLLMLEWVNCDKETVRKAAPALYARLVNWEMARLGAPQ